MIKWVNSVVLVAVLIFPTASGRPKSHTLLRGSKLSEPEQVVVHTRMKDIGDEETQRIEIRHEVESPGSHEQPKMTRDHLYRSFSSTPQRLKSGKKSKKTKSDHDSNVFSHLSSKKSKKDAKKDKSNPESKPVDLDNATSIIDEIISNRNRKHSSIPVERNAPVYKSTPTLKPTTIPTSIPTPTPSHDDTQNINNEITGRFDTSTRHPKLAFPRPPLNQNDEYTSSDTTVPSSKLPTVAPVRMPTRQRNYATPPTRSDITDKYRDDDRRDNLNGNHGLCDGKNHTPHDFPISSEIEIIDDIDDGSIISDEKQDNQSVSQNTTKDVVIIEEDASNVQRGEGIDQEPTDTDTIVQNTTSVDKNEETIGEGTIEDERKNEDSRSEDHNEDTTEQVTVEDETPIETPSSNTDNEVIPEQENIITGAAPSDGTSPVSQEKSSRSTWKKVVTGLIPSCLLCLCLLIFLYYRASRRKKSGFGGIQKSVEKMEKIDNTIPLDQTGGSGYSRMNSIKSFQDFDDSKSESKSELPDPSEDLVLLPHSTPTQSTGMYDLMPNRFESNSADQSNESTSMFESEGDGQIGNIDNFTDDDGDYDYDDIIENDEDDDEGEDDFYVYNYDHEIEEVELVEIDEMDMEESSSSYIEEEFLSTIEEESHSYRFSTGDSNSHHFSTSDNNRLASW